MEKQKEKEFQFIVLVINIMEIILEGNLKIVNQTDMEFIYINLGLEQEIDLKAL